MLQTAFTPYPDVFIEYINSTTKHNMPVQHYHDNYEIYLQISGERYLFHNDICHTLKRGDLVVFRPFDIHYTESREAGSYERYLLNFTAEKLSSLLTPIELQLLFEKLDSCVLSLTEEQTTQFLMYFQNIEDYSKREGFLADKLLYSAILQLIVAISNLTNLHNTEKNSSIPSEIIVALNYINLHYHETLTLDYIADYVHMSKYHFCRLFHQATGATFLEHVYNTRLAKVHQLLSETSLPLCEIARKTGFSSTAHLSRVFRQVYHMSPREFRKNC